MKYTKSLLIAFFASSLSLSATEFVVEFKDAPSVHTLSQLKTSTDYRLLRTFEAFDKNYVVLKSHPENKPSTVSLKKIKNQLFSLGASRIEENFTYQLLAGPKPPPNPDDLSDFNPKPLQPNDKYFNMLWGLLNYGQKIQQNGTRKMDSAAAQAWNYFRGSSRMIVGVMDTGVDYKHEDLQGNLWSQKDSRGKVSYGYSAFDDSSDVMDFHGHGTHVSGTIGARGNNGVGVVGVNWDVSIASIKIFGANGETRSDVILRGLYWCYKNRHMIRLINHSWGGSEFSQFIYEAFKVLDESGVVNVIAAGNNGAELGFDTSKKMITIYPALYKLQNSIVVAAHDNRGRRASFSNFSETYVDIAAPGVDIRSSVPGNFYETYSGTSMAAPHVAGAAALLWGAYPSLSSHELKARLIEAGEATSSLRGVSRASKRLNILNLFQ
jgi:subtilisin family serine protease